MRNLFLIFLVFLIFSCNTKTTKHSVQDVRPLMDTIGYAQHDWQMETYIERLDSVENLQPDSLKMEYTGSWKALISPHDDYVYAGNVYKEVFEDLRPHVILVFGVAHSAGQMNVEDRIVFDSYTAWHGPFGPVPVSGIREDLMQRLPNELFQVNDSLHRMEHSIEALIPFLQYYKRDLEIIPILVPRMSFQTMDSISRKLAYALKKIIEERQLIWNRDFAMVISNDAVHYGDQGWSGRNLAPYGADTAGYQKAIEYDMRIIDAISGRIKPSNVKEFMRLTLQEDDYKKYRWTWCGRYSVPFGLITAFHLNRMTSGDPLMGTAINYSTSINRPMIPTEDIGLGSTAPANIRHWVGYAGIGYY